MAEPLISRIIRLPTAGGASDFLRADEPLGAGTMHLVVNNLQHLAGENTLRHLYTFAGYRELCSDMPFSGVATFDWDAYYLGTKSDPRSIGGSNAEGVGIFDTGPVTIKRHSHYARWPRVEWRFRWTAPAGFEMGAFAVCLRNGEQPSATVPYAEVTENNVGFINGSLTVDLAAWGDVPSESVTPSATSAEEGRVYTARFMLGVWCTSGDKVQPGKIAGVTCFLREPA